MAGDMNPFTPIGWALYLAALLVTLAALVVQSRALVRTRKLWRYAQRAAVYWREQATGVDIVPNGPRQSWEWAEKTPVGARLADIIELPKEGGHG